MAHTPLVTRSPYPISCCASQTDHMCTAVHCVPHSVARWVQNVRDTSQHSHGEMGWKQTDSIWRNRH